MSMMMGISSPNTRRLEFRDKGGKVVGSVTIKSAKSQETKKKRLPYSYKEISTRLLNAKKSGNAHQVLISAKQKVASLRLMYKGGVYDDNEIFNALMHAQAITRVAKKRRKHLEEEERVEHKGGPCEAELEEKTEQGTAKQLREEDPSDVNLQRMQKLMEQYERMMEEAMKALERIDDMDEFSEDMGISVRQSMDPEDLEMMKKKHRADEMKEIMEADMKYLKAMFDKFEKEKQTIGSNAYGMNGYDRNGVSLQLGGMSISTSASPSAAAVVEGGTIDTAV